MALTSDSVTKCKTTIEGIQNDLKELTSSVNELYNYITTNANYNRFTSSTRLGSEHRSKMNTILKILNNDLLTQTNSLISNLNNFISVQETINTGK